MIEIIRQARNAGLLGEELPAAETDNNEEYIRLLLTNGIRTMDLLMNLQQRVAALEEVQHERQMASNDNCH